MRIITVVHHCTQICASRTSYMSHKKQQHIVCIAHLPPLIDSLEELHNDKRFILNKE